MTSRAPRAFNRDTYHNNPRHMVYYGTDDGYPDGSCGEIAVIRAHYEGVAPSRRDDIHMISVVGGLYGLNLIPLWRPKQITFFDINPTAITYFRVIRRVLTTSRDAQHFLGRLTDGDYSVDTEEEDFIRENIRFKQQGWVPAERGNTKRPYEQSWKYALDNFEVTRQILTEAPIDLRSEPMESGDFRAWIRDQGNVWIYGSNITQFHFFELDFSNPTNVVMLQIHHADVDLLDLAPLSGGPVRLKCEIPLSAERIAP